MSPLPSDDRLLNMHSMASLGELFKRHITMPLAHVRDWKPFQIDALGLVTLLGADEVNQSVGTLQHRRFTEYLPLLAAFVIAGDRFVTEQPGFVLYNLTDGITSTELKGWFTRWLMSQRVNNATTVLTWDTNKEPRDWKDRVAPLLSFILVMPLLVITVLVGDWYGVGNAAAIIISILTRIYLLSRRRRTRDDDAAAPKKAEKEEQKTLCVIRSDGKMVTCMAPQSVLNTFVKNSKVKHEKSYHIARWLCWLALGVHMCILGMCSLITQIYTVLLLVLSTWWFTSDFPWDVGREIQTKGSEFEKSVIKIPFNGDWSVEQIDHPTEKVDGAGVKKAIDKRQYAWARLDLDAGAEGAMKAWNLFPIEEKSGNWLQDYKDLKKSLKDKKQPGDAEKDSRTSAAQDADVSRPISTALSTARLTAEGTPPATSGISPTPTLTGGASRTSSPGNMERVPAGD
jgi:hypothetical protein